MDRSAADNQPASSGGSKARGVWRSISGDATGKVDYARVRRLPFFRLFAYYAVLVGVAILAARYVPVIRESLLAPISTTATATELTPGTPFPRSLPPPPVSPLANSLQRSISTGMVTLGAFLLSLPVAWVYMYTRRLRYDRALVHSVIILPLVVAGIVVVVKDSIALAFSLAGIVAAVRFRNTLKDPRDAVYIFLALGIGLSSGVQALDIALVSSLAFNIAVLVLWKFNVGAAYPTENASALALGDVRLHVARTEEQREEMRALMARHAPDMEMDGFLLVQTTDPDHARHEVELALTRVAKEWRFADPLPGAPGHATLPALVSFRKKSNPMELISDLDENWSDYISAAEYVPFRVEEGKDD